MEQNMSFNDILKQQTIITKQLEEQINLYEKSDLRSENLELVDKIQKLDAERQSLISKLEESEISNKNLKNAVFGYSFNEKLGLLSSSKAKVDIYFSDANNKQLSKLAQVEQYLLLEINKLESNLDQNNSQETQKLYTGLNNLKQEVDNTIVAQRNHAANSMGNLYSHANQQYNDLAQTPLTDEQIQKVASKNKVEQFVGLNLINKIGIFLIVIGVFAASQFAYQKLGNELRGAMIFLAGILLLGGGEFASRKKSSVFSTGLLAGGVAVLYIALGVSFFSLEIIGMYMAIILCVLITLVAFFLSVKHNAQVIAAFALIGGYLPLMPIVETENMIIGAMVYFLLLNLLQLSISFHKKWKVTSFMGLIFNIVGTLTISLTAVWSLDELRNITIAVTIGYVFLSFLIYTLVPIISSYRTKAQFKVSDVVFIAINTVFSALTLYLIFYLTDLELYYGILTIVFAVIYFLTAKLSDKLFSRGTKISVLFYISALTFSVLITPIQFGIGWITLGWLIEAVILYIYGVIGEERIAKKAGSIIFGLCAIAFILYDLPSQDLFVFKYLAITLGSVAMLVATLYKKVTLSKGESLFKIATVINLWMFLMYIIFDELYYILPKDTALNKYYLMSAAAIVITALYGYIIARIPKIYSKGIRVFSIVLYICTILLGFTVHLVPVVPLGETVIGYSIVATIIVFVISILMVLVLRDLTKMLFKEKRNILQMIPFILSVASLVLLTQNIIIQFQISASSAIISIILAVAAFLWIFFGFKRQDAAMRRAGLILSMATVAKLFLVDLHALTEGYRIITYFALGIALLAISFIYQTFSKKLESQKGLENFEESANDSNNN